MINQTPNLEYHRGQICALKYLVCQEGYCSDCSIYRDSLRRRDDNVDQGQEAAARKISRPLLDMV